MEIRKKISRVKKIRAKLGLGLTYDGDPHGMGSQNTKKKNFFGGGGSMRHLPVESGETFPLCGGQVDPLPLPVGELPPHQAEKVLQILNPP
jgi:hypothetical protein